ncbi:MAG: hypothetical protein EKK64_09890 [Neisseriaceae bacterium]|nr:MAG: hypothetical protein EKK64_09890 [Neisseriaceae bacterium]
MDNILFTCMVLGITYFLIFFLAREKEESIFKYKQTIENGVIENYIYVTDHPFISGEPSYVLHSKKDEPAIIYPSGTKEWYFYGKLHRLEGPAIIHQNGDKEWWYHGKRHRNNGPALICGKKQYWYEHGEFIKQKD